MKNLSLDHLRDANLRRREEWRHSQAGGLSGEIAVMFAAIELAGESGELLNKIKKAARIWFNLAGGTVDTKAIRDELADVVICADLLAIELGIALAPAIVSKFNETTVKMGFYTLLTGQLESTAERDLVDLDGITDLVDRLNQRADGATNAKLYSKSVADAGGGEAVGYDYELDKRSATAMAAMRDEIHDLRMQLGHYRAKAEAESS